MKLSALFIFLFAIISCNSNKSAIEIYNEGMDNYNDSSFSSALKCFKLASEKDNKNANAFLFKAICESKLDQYKEAMLSFESSIHLDSTNSYTFLERAKLKIKLGDFNSAINDCNTASFLKNNNADIYSTEAFAYENMNDKAYAIFYYEKAIKHGQKDGATFYKLGILKLPNLEEACPLLSKAGELGYMEAYEMIKRNCSPRAGKTIEFQDDSLSSLNNSHLSNAIKKK